MHSRTNQERQSRESCDGWTNSWETLESCLERCDGWTIHHGPNPEMSDALWQQSYEGRDVVLPVRPVGTLSRPHNTVECHASFAETSTITNRLAAAVILPRTIARDACSHASRSPPRRLPTAGLAALRRVMAFQNGGSTAHTLRPLKPRPACFIVGSKRVKETTNTPAPLHEGEKTRDTK